MVSLVANKGIIDKHFSDIKDIVQKRIQTVFTRGINKKGRGNRIALSVPLINYLQSLLVDSNLETLINATPDELVGIASTFERTNPSFFNKKTNDFYVLTNIFDGHAYSHLDKLQFIRNISIDTCAYCNRCYTYTLSRQDMVKPELDHFLSKTKFPIFAVSFYNLIPSCQTCNGIHVKGQKDSRTADLVNPYKIKPDDFKLAFEIKSIDVVNPLSNKDSVSVFFSKSITGHIEVFKLGALYSMHSDHVLELIVKSKLEYSDSYREYLASYTELKFSPDEIDRLILGNYSAVEDMHKRPLAKLYQDIGEQLGLINRKHGI